MSSYYGARFETQVKHPDEIVNQQVTVDLPDGVTIGSVSVLEVEPSGELTAEMQTTVGNVVTCQLAAGDLHKTYVVSIRVPLSNGERRTLILIVDVK
jgi:hypothetical protein